MRSHSSPSYSYFGWVNHPRRAEIEGSVLLLDPTSRYADARSSYRAAVSFRKTNNFFSKGRVEFNLHDSSHSPDVRAG